MEKKEHAKLVIEHRFEKRHIGHENHLCDLVARRQIGRVAHLSKGARYMCHICGRAAIEAANLCEPILI